MLPTKQPSGFAEGVAWARLVPRPGTTFGRIGLLASLLDAFVNTKSTTYINIVLHIWMQRHYIFSLPEWILKLRSMHWNVLLMSKKSNLEEQTIWTNVATVDPPLRFVLTWLLHISSFHLHGALDVARPLRKWKKCARSPTLRWLGCKADFCNSFLPETSRKKHHFFGRYTSKLRIGSFWLRAIEVGNDLSYQCFIYLAICLQDAWLIALLE